MMVSNELLDYLGKAYEAAHPDSEQSAEDRDIIFLKYVEIYVDNVEYMSKKVELEPFTVAFYKECKKH